MPDYSGKPTVWRQRASVPASASTIQFAENATTADHIVAHFLDHFGGRRGCGFRAPQPSQPLHLRGRSRRKARHREHIRPGEAKRSLESGVSTGIILIRSISSATCGLLDGQTPPELENVLLGVGAWQGFAGVLVLGRNRTPIRAPRSTRSSRDMKLTGGSGIRAMPVFCSPTSAGLCFGKAGRRSARRSLSEPLPDPPGSKSSTSMIGLTVGTCALGTQFSIIRFYLPLVAVFVESDPPAGTQTNCNPYHPLLFIFEGSVVSLLALVGGIGAVRVSCMGMERFFQGAV